MIDKATPSDGSRIFYTAFLIGSILTFAVAAVFFVIGLGDGSVSSFNPGLWLILLAAMAPSL